MKIDEYKKSLLKPHKPRTVIFLNKDNRVLLGYKKNGFGKGYYLGIGGKVEKNESIEAGAIREFQEEVGIKLDTANLKKVAILDFYFPHITDESWNQQVHAFVVSDWEGDPQETEEIKPVWFEYDHLLFDDMWDDAKYWIPSILKGKEVHEAFVFNNKLKVNEHQKAQLDP